jgi:hypothetical protein
MRLFNMDVSELFTVSNFAAVLAITADSACVWATPDVTPLSRVDCVELPAQRVSRMDLDHRHIDGGPSGYPVREGRGGQHSAAHRSFPSPTVATWTRLR